MNTLSRTSVMCDRLLSVPKRWSRSIIFVSLLSSAALADGVPRPPTQLCVNMGVCATESGGENVRVRGAVNWHPGHYVSTKPFKSDSEVRSAARGAEMKEVVNPSRNWAGLATRVTWSALEGREGDYSKGFAAIDSLLANLEPAKKSLIIQVMPTMFGNSKCRNVVPEYICSQSKYRGGTITHQSAVAARMWDANVATRFISLISAICSRYANNPYFEGISGAETALNIGSTRPSGFSWDAYYTQLKRVHVEAERACPTTNVISYINFGGAASYQYELVDFIASRRGMMGGPDIFNPKYRSYTQGQVGYMGNAPAPFNRDRRNSMGAAFAVQYKTYNDNRGDIGAIFDTAMTLKATHVMWQFPPSPRTIRDVATTLSREAWRIGKTGCPSNYPRGCNTSKP